MTYLIPGFLVLILGGAPESGLVRQLTEQGLPVDAQGKSFVKLPGATMPDGLDAAAQRRAIEQVAGPRRSMKHLLRDSVVAPFVLKIDEVSTGEAEEPFRRVDVWYVAHGELKSFSDEEFFEAFVDLAPAKKKSRFPLAGGILTPDELRRRGLRAVDSPQIKQRYCYSTVDLFDRVLISTTRRVVVTIGSESVLVAAVIDRRLTRDADYPNQWRSIEFGKDGQFSLGPPQAYVHSASYTKITRLHDPAGALFIEHHHVFAEPRGWFAGKNLLRSKLPLATQHSVRTLRQKLKSAAARARSDSTPRAK